MGYPRTDEGVRGRMGLDHPLWIETYSDCGSKLIPMGLDHSLWIETYSDGYPNPRVDIPLWDIRSTPISGTQHPGA